MEIDDIHIVGIDPSLSGTGLCFINKLNIPITEIIKTKKMDNRFDRYDYIVHKILDFVPDTTNLVVIEHYSFGSIGKQTDLAELGGIIRYALYVNKVKFIEVAPSSLKKFITGRGNAKKDEMILAISKKYNKHFKDDNIADAYALAQWGYTNAINHI
ncbi:MAG TPA: crossover junction endodeoxyribonuclease RuvC [Chitinophagales bacterium]|nr:crossover junction endodeoxyribonuclease RuvC [Chitinophagales bacterium]